VKKDLEYFLGLRYRIELEEQEEGGYVAHHPDLRGCIAQGDTAEEAVESLSAARQAWMEARLEDGFSVPEPREEPSYSGKLLLRMPKSLHQELAEAAERDGVSLNQFVVAALSRQVWNRDVAPTAEYVTSYGCWNQQGPVAPVYTDLSSITFVTSNVLSLGVGKSSGAVPSDPECVKKLQLVRT
jgi:predicted RNase H-like HicB family nuclease